MIGKFLDSLTVEQEDRVLLTPLRELGTKWREVECVVEVAYDAPGCWTEDGEIAAYWSVGERHDELVKRRGIAEAGKLYRNRILANRARRTMT